MIRFKKSHKKVNNESITNIMNYETLASVNVLNDYYNNNECEWLTRSR